MINRIAFSDKRFFTDSVCKRELKREDARVLWGDGNFRVYFWYTPKEQLGKHLFVLYRLSS